MSEKYTVGEDLKGLTGKVMKGPNYKPPDLKKVILVQKRYPRRALQVLKPQPEIKLILINN